MYWLGIFIPSRCIVLKGQLLKQISASSVDQNTSLIGQESFRRHLVVNGQPLLWLPRPPLGRERWPPVSRDQFPSGVQSFVCNRLGFPPIDSYSDGYFDIFAWLIMFVALLHRWLSPLCQAEDPLVRHDSTCPNETSALSLSSPASLMDTADVNRRFSEDRESVPTNFCPNYEVFTQDGRCSDDRAESSPHSFAIPGISIKLNLLLSDFKEAICPSNGQCYDVEEDVLKATEASGEVCELFESERSDGNDYDYAEHTITILLTPSFTSEYATNTLLPGAAILKASLEATLILEEEAPESDSPACDSYSLSATCVEVSKCMSTSSSSVTASTIVGDSGSDCSGGPIGNAPQEELFAAKLLDPQQRL